jgi:hypothetical protein
MCILSNGHAHSSGGTVADGYTKHAADRMSQSAVTESWGSKNRNQKDDDDIGRRG